MVKGTGNRGVGSNVNVTQNVSPQNETRIAADPANPFNLAAGTNDYRYGDAGAGFAYSPDLDQSYFDSVIVDII